MPRAARSRAGRAVDQRPARPNASVNGNSASDLGPRCGGAVYAQATPPPTAPRRKLDDSAAASLMPTTAPISDTIENLFVKSRPKHSRPKVQLMISPAAGKPASGSAFPQWRLHRVRPPSTRLPPAGKASWHVYVTSSTCWRGQGAGKPRLARTSIGSARCASSFCKPSSRAASRTPLSGLPP